MNILRILILLLLIPGALLANDDLQKFGESFFAWRAKMQPASGDDINRVERPKGWVPDYSPEALQQYHQDYKRFRNELDGISQNGWKAEDSVDFLLLHSAVERINWELNVLRLPYRNPDFYVHQSLGVLFELLVVHTPMTDQRIEEIILRIGSIPATLNHAKVNLKEPFAGGAVIALNNLEGIDHKLEAMQVALESEAHKRYHKKLRKATEEAVEALLSYKKWLEENMPQMTKSFEVGRENYNYFLKNIALLPYTPEELLTMGEMEWSRSVAFDVYEQMRNIDEPQPELFKDMAEQIATEARQEQEVRDFMEKMNIMSVPDDVNHYLNKELTPYLQPLAHMGVTDDLTSESRLHLDGVSYIREPSWDLPYFYRAIAQDPRPIIIHEGVPGHYFQLVRSWKNPDPIRRRFFDSGPIEGIGFYVEEMLLQFGLLNDRPRTREIMYSFMRLRALRVDIDVNLAVGNYNIAQAAHYLETIVPMDKETAVEEAGFFSLTPGQAISYQIGKIQIMKFLADAKIQQGGEFNLRRFHDYLMVNGNVPIALQRYEYLGKTDELSLLWP
ncbi:DUF885 family protein [Porifericola rhodea]|uniref:DUF885 family protein n=1 Tax=Porifericola rhodea TaxID=930972 RepID=UPI0026653452|nr:DUF885 family protein [Porifericola rhodea]WKN33287.1 DUF885 family protein [Porifericola rhodea]